MTSPKLLCAALAVASLAPLATLRCQHHDNCAPSRRQLESRPSYQIEKARQAFTHGRETAMWTYLDRAVTRLGPRALANKELRGLLREQEAAFVPAELHQATAGERVEALLEHGRVGLRPGRRAALVALLAEQPGARVALRCEARTNARPARRLLALCALIARADRDDRVFALRAAVHDRSKQVRRGLCERLQGAVRPSDVRFLSVGLGSLDGAVRVRTAEALGMLGHRDAVDPLIAAAPHAARGLRRAGADGATTRGHVAFVDQTAYVRDVDVEVASAAFIADPKVDALQSGAVLDARVMGVTTVRHVQRAYRRALRDLLGKDLGHDVSRWRSKAEGLRARAR